MLISKKNIVLFGSSGLIGSSIKKKLKNKYNLINIDLKKNDHSDIRLDTGNFILLKKKNYSNSQRYQKN